MRKININTRIIKSLDLSQKERLVFESLLSLPLGGKVSSISKETGLPRMTISDILRRLEKRKLAERIRVEKSSYWKYKRGLEFFEEIKDNTL